MAENFFKVKLRSQVTKAVIAFDVVPDVNETRNVEYKSMNPVHMPGTIYAYGHSASRLFGVNNARFISRTPEEAAYNLARLNILRSWTMPYFGDTGNSDERGSSSVRDLLGSPPDVLSFYAFAVGPSGAPLTENASGQSSNPNDPESPQDRMRATHIHNIPTVVHNLQITYPSDIDYIPTAAAKYQFGTGPRQFTVDIDAGVPMPTIMTTDIQLYETHSPSEFNRFRLEDYRAGRLTNF